MSKDFLDAISAGYRDRVSRMRAAEKALLSAKTDNGLGPFTVGKYSGRNEIAAPLVKNGVALDFFAACVAAARQRVVEVAAAYPELIHSYRHDGWTLLHLACYHPAIAGALIRSGECPGAFRKEMQNAPLHAPQPGTAGSRFESYWSTERTCMHNGADGAPCTRHCKMGT